MYLIKGMLDNGEPFKLRLLCTKNIVLTKNLKKKNVNEFMIV